MSEGADSGEIPLEPMTIIESAVVVTETEPPVATPTDEEIGTDDEPTQTESENDTEKENTDPTHMNDESE